VLEIFKVPRFGSLAQSVEQLAFNQLVAGSNPARPTIIRRSRLKKHKRGCHAASSFCLRLAIIFQCHFPHRKPKILIALW
jgi:hypothetical protein